MATGEIPYLTLDCDLEAQIRADLDAGRKNPYAARDADALRREDNPHDAPTLARPPFARDVEKILNVPAYNRYAGKTQVFSFVENDDICHRDLHVQLVMRIARGIGRLLGLNLDLIEAISLGHDVGHTPFGHAGEHFLSDIYHARTGRFFNHNVHSVRVLDRIYPRNITLQTLNGVLCHNGEFASQRLNLSPMLSFAELDHACEGCRQDASRIEHLRPSTLEACVVRVSDMIAYIGKDRDDAIELGALRSLDIFDADYIGRDNPRIINNMTVDIVHESYGKPYIGMSRAAYLDLRRAKAQNSEIIYQREGMRGDSSNVVEEMFQKMYAELLRQLARGDEDSPVYRHHIRVLSRRSRTIEPDSYLREDPDQIVVDYIASMTDNYFLSLYGYLFPDDTPELVQSGYTTSLKR